MNQADKAEALRLIREIAAASPGVISGLAALIDRQDDTDGEMWRFCVEHGFPSLTLPSNTSDREAFGVWVNGELHYADTPAEAVQAAMAAMKEKS